MVGHLVLNQETLVQFGLPQPYSFRRGANQTVPQQFGKIFLGNTPAEQRRFVRGVLSHLRNVHGLNCVVIPCVGQFALPKCAIEAGFTPEQIEVSDISLFSSLLGCVFSGKPIESLNMTLSEEVKWKGGLGSCRLREEYRELKSEESRAAYLFWLMKIAQFRPHLKYEFQYYENVIREADRHRQNFEKKLLELKSVYGGLKYDLADVRDVVGSEYDDKTILIPNPPLYRGGYQKMYAFEAFIQFSSGIDEFDFRDEYLNLYQSSKEKPYVAMWGLYVPLPEIPEKDIVFADQQKHDHFEYWLCTKPEMLASFPRLYDVKFKSAAPLKAWHRAKIWGDDDELTPDTDVKLVLVGGEQALYYRELWAHKLGTTKAESYYLILLDGKVFGTVGMFASDLLRLQSDKVSEVFGFNAPSKKYRNINRLLMYLLTCSAFKDVLRASMSKKNRYYTLNGFKTTCLAKYRHVKLNSGLLKIVKRSRMKNGLYKIGYECEFREQTFREALNAYLDEWKAKNEATSDKGTS